MVSEISSPRRSSRAIRAVPTGISCRPRAADIARCRNRGRVCSSKRPSAAAAVRPSAARLRAAGGNVGRRVAQDRIACASAVCSGSVIIVRSAPQHGGAGAQAAIVVDHAEAATTSAMPRVLDLRRQGLPGELPHRFDQPEKAAGGTGLPDRQLPARGVERKRAVDRECVARTKSGAFALLAEAEILELHAR